MQETTRFAAGAWKMGLLLVCALGVRLLFFTGLAVGDDTIYGPQSLALTQHGHWPPEPLHWTTRLGIILPTVVSLKLLGLRPIAFVLLPLVASTLSVLVCFLAAKDLTGDRRTAWLAALFQAVFPLEVIYSTHLFPDVVVALFSVLSIWFWIRALRGDREWDYFLCGLFFAGGYACRETVFMEGPVYLALWALAGRLRRPRMAWVFVAPVLLLAVESGVYAVTAGSALYRWKAVAFGAQLKDPLNRALVEKSVSGGTFWTDPLLLLVTSTGFGLYHLVALALSPLLWFRFPSFRPLIAWLVVGFFWIYYGTTVPTGWVTLQRDARYAAFLTVPSVILVARFLLAAPAWIRWPVGALLVASGLFAAGLDQGSSVLKPFESFLDGDWANDATVEPSEYYAARWKLGLTQSPPFACASDRGRASVAHLLASLDGAVMRPSTQARYFVFSPLRRPDLLPALKAEGWTVAAEIPGEPTPSRALVARWLRFFPSQQERADRIAHPTGLLVMERPPSPG
jgi:hypothetical protein